MTKLTLKSVGNPSPATRVDSAHTIDQRISRKVRAVTVERKHPITKAGAKSALRPIDIESELMADLKSTMIGQERPPSQSGHARVERYQVNAATNKSRVKAELERERHAQQVSQQSLTKKKVKKPRIGKKHAMTFVLPVPPTPEPIYRRRKLSWPKAERQKDRVAQVAIEMLKGRLPNVQRARTVLNEIESFELGSWSEKDRSRHAFARAVLVSIIDGKKPPRIVQPDGKYFKWPNTDIGSPRGQASSVEATQEVGVLKSVGYQVGLHGVPTYERRQLLAVIFEKELRVDLEPAYLNEWGRPGTSMRLRKLAHTIATLTRNMKRRTVSAPSIGEWEADLEYLKRRYYVGRFDFPWPAA